MAAVINGEAQPRPVKYRHIFNFQARMAGSAKPRGLIEANITTYQLPAIGAGVTGGKRGLLKAVLIFAGLL